MYYNAHVATVLIVIPASSDEVIVLLSPPRFYPTLSPSNRPASLTTLVMFSPYYTHAAYPKKLRGGHTDLHFPEIVWRALLDGDTEVNIFITRPRLLETLAKDM